MGDLCGLNSFDTTESHNYDVKWSCIAHNNVQVNRSFSYHSLSSNPIGICMWIANKHIYNDNKSASSGRTRDINFWPSHASVYAFIYLKLIINI